MNVEDATPPGREAAWEEIRRWQLRRTLLLTPAERLAALEAMIRFAAKAGTLQKAHARRMEAIDKQWSGG